MTYLAACQRQLRHRHGGQIAEGEGAWQRPGNRTDRFYGDDGRALAGVLRSQPDHPRCEKYLDKLPHLRREREKLSLPVERVLHLL